MKKSLIKKIFVAIMLIILFSIINITYITNAGMFDGMIANIDSASSGDKTGISENVQKNYTTIIVAVKIVAVAVAVLMLLALAMKYMAAAPGEKADIKKSATVYVVGAIVLFSAAGILQIIESFSTIIS